MLAYNIYVPICNVRPIILWVCLCLIRLRPNEVLVADVSRLNRIRFFSLSHFRFVLGWVWPLSWGTLDFDKARRQLEQYYKRPLQKKGWLIFLLMFGQPALGIFFVVIFLLVARLSFGDACFLFIFIFSFYFLFSVLFCFLLLLFSPILQSHIHIVSPWWKKIEN